MKKIQDKFIWKIKICLITIVLSIFSLSSSNSYAETDESTNTILSGVKYNENVFLWDTWNLDLSSLSDELTEKYNSKIILEWNTRWEATETWTSYSKQFESFWEKNIILSVYKQSWDKKELIVDKNFDIYVYKKSLAFISESDLKEQIDEYKMKSKENWVIIYDIATLSVKDIETYNFLEKIEKYKNSFWSSSDYVVIWWSRDFLFDVINKINTKIEDQELNLVLVSSFNMKILKNYLQNFISNKSWIKNALLLNESSKFEISKNAESISSLEDKVAENKYDYINLNNNSAIKSVLFISRFVNDLSNKWFNTTNIYIILLVPFLLIWVIFFKHLIWLSPAGLLIPTVMTILLLKVWLLLTLWIMLVFLLTNLILAKLINSYKLHYTPKVTLLIITNIVVFIIAINLVSSRWWLNLDINDFMFIVFFIFISEKLVNLIVSKEFSEYKMSLVNTLLFSLISYLFFSLSIVKTFILAYPELILFLIPISFLMGRFTWLRVSEYFRFKEVIRSIEEE